MRMSRKNKANEEDEYEEEADEYEESISKTPIATASVPHLA